ncbi:hypothetical protein J6590_064941 [Homalodisca vitripennis]|nr:hypothetical protein J6590_064941 [Homalodisca vitripennis]
MTGQKLYGYSKKQLIKNKVKVSEVKIIKRTDFYPVRRKIVSSPQLRASSPANPFGETPIRHARPRHQRFMYLTFCITGILLSFHLSRQNRNLCLLQIDASQI